VHPPGKFTGRSDYDSETLNSSALNTTAAASGFQPAGWKIAADGRAV
jgi:hypothetical protein